MLCSSRVFATINCCFNITIWSLCAVPESTRFSVRERMLYLLDQFSTSFVVILWFSHIKVGRTNFSNQLKFEFAFVRSLVSLFSKNFTDPILESFSSDLYENVVDRFQFSNQFLQFHWIWISKKLILESFLFLYLWNFICIWICIFQLKSNQNWIVNFCVIF